MAPRSGDATLGTKRQESEVRSMSTEHDLIIHSPSGRHYRIELSDPTAIAVFDERGRRMLRVALKGTSSKAMVKRIRENIETGAPAYLAAWPPKDVDRILTCHAIACER
jgi:hypothetical protein